jgi:hypothetical protein
MLPKQILEDYISPRENFETLRVTWPTNLVATNCIASSDCMRYPKRNIGFGLYICCVSLLFCHFVSLMGMTL